MNDLAYFRDQFSLKIILLDAFLRMQCRLRAVVEIAAGSDRVPASLFSPVAFPQIMCQREEQCPGVARPVKCPFRFQRFQESLLIEILGICIVRTELQAKPINIRTEIINTFFYLTCVHCLTSFACSPKLPCVRSSGCVHSFYLSSAAASDMKINMVKLFVSPHIRHDFLCGSFFLKIIEQGNDLLHDSPLCGLVSLHGAAQSSREDFPCSPRRHLSVFADGYSCA